MGEQDHDTKHYQPISQVKAQRHWTEPHSDALAN